MLTIPGYTLIAPVSEVGDLRLYHATRMLDGASVLLKVASEPSPKVQSWLKHEYEVARDLDPNRIARPIALEQHGDTPVLLLEPGPDRTLASLLGSPMEVRSFLQIAIAITTDLSEIHRHELVHKDIKPENVLLDGAGHVWLTGLGIASRLPKEHQPPEPPEAIDGTLAYMAPEQTGRMNRSIDFRSDLYALGISFYQMLTGELPFAAHDAMEWVYCHVARQPVPPSQRVPEIPEALSEIVMKLMTKTAEDRYQSIAGLDADFHHCLTEWDSKGFITPFPLGRYDIPDRLLVPEKLYGRKSELDILLTAFNRVVESGTSELVLVSGYSGIGKTSVVYELHKALVPPRGLFAAGKFDQYKRDIPYATLIQALQTLVRHILGKNEDEVERWRDEIQKAVGPNGQLMISLIPEVKLIIGEQPPVPELPPQESRNRFQMVLLQFISVFAGTEHPLALFLDDLQWLDGATLDLLTHLITESKVRGLLLIGAYRDNEVTPAHPLMLTIGTIRKTGASVQDIVLTPLTINDVCCLVADSLLCTQEHALPLSELVHEKTGGNPFFVIQFLTALAEEKLVTFDQASGYWTWDLAGIRSKNFADNVVDLMVEKLRRLPAVTQEAIKQMACLGNVSDVDTLATVYGGTEEEIRTALWQAVLAGLLYQQDKTFKFLHDRIRQAAYSLIPEEHRAEVHLRIGRLLLSQTPEDRLAENIFEIIGHLNMGTALIISQEECQRLAELNLLAGKRAKDTTAYASALNFFIIGGNFLTEDAWESQHELAFAIEFNRAVCEFLSGNIEEAEDRLLLLSDRTDNLIDASAVACQRIEVNTTQNQIQRAVEIGLEYLQRIDAKWTFHPSDDEVQWEYQRLLQQLGDRRVEDLIDLPPAKPDQRAVMDVLTTLDTAALFFDKNLLALIIARIVSLSLEHGNSDGSCLGYVWLHHFFAPLFSEYELGYRFGRLACDLVEKRGLIRYEPRVYQSFCWVISPWTRHISECREMIRRSFVTAQEIGQLPSTFAARFIDVSIGLFIGDSLADLQPDVEIGLELSRKAGFEVYVIHFTGKLRFVQSLRGFKDIEFEEEKFETFMEANPERAMGAFWYWIRKLQALSYAGSYTAAMVAAVKVKQFFHLQSGIIEVAEYHLHSALAQAALYDTVSADEQAQYMEAIKTHHQQLTDAARHCPANFADRSALVAAEIARIEGRDLEAMRGYEQSIQSARENGFVHNKALAHELASRFYRTRGFETIAEAYLREARSCYQSWGADGKVRQLEQLYPWLAQSQAPQTATLAEQLDAVAVAKAQRAISSEIQLDRLAQTLLRMVMESAGAQTGYLSVEGAGQLRSEMKPDDKGSPHIFFDDSPRDANIPETIINYVRRSRKTVILDDARGDAGEFSDDDYLRRVRPRSVLSMAIKRQEKLLAVLYLENNLMSGAFTPERRTVLEVLAAQAAISLETAGVYKKLYESEQRLRLTLKATQIGIFDWDVAQDRWYASPEYYTMLGYQSREGSGNREEWLERVHPDDRVNVNAQIQNMLARSPSSDQSREYRYEARMRHTDGTYRWVQVKGFGIERDQEGKVTRTLGIRMDITERKQAEEELARNLAINQTLSSLHIPLVTTGTSIEQIAHIVLEKSSQLTNSTHGYIGEIDPSTGDLVAHTNTKMMQTECTIVEEELRKVRFPQREDSLYNGLWGYALNTKEAFYDNAPEKHPASVGIPEGHIVIEKFLTVPVLLGGELAGQIALANSVRDYTDRDLEAVNRIAEFFALAIQNIRAYEALKESEKSLRENEERMQLALKGANLGFFDFNIQKKTLIVDDGWLEILGYSPDEIKIDVDTWWSWIHPDDRPRQAEAFQDHVAGRNPYYHLDEYRARGKSEDWVWLSDHGKVVEFDSEGNPLRLVGIHLNITERKKAEEKIRTLNQELEQRVLERTAELESFAYSVSHDLRAPLRHISGFIGLLEKRISADLDKKSLHYMANISNSTQKMEQLIDDLLSFSRMGRQTMSFSEINLTKMVGDVIEELDSDTGGKKTEWHVGELPVVRGDMPMLRIVLMNLLSNAVKFSSLRENPYIEIGSEFHDRENVIFVRDNGVGFDPIYSDKLFGVFQRLHHTHEFEGTGVGLAIVQRIIQRHGGRVWAEGKVDGGATFYFSFLSGLKGERITRES